MYKAYNRNNIHVLCLSDAWWNNSKMNCDKIIGIIQK